MPKIVGNITGRVPGGNAKLYYVDEYGADPTGVVESRPAIQRALNDIGTAGGGTLVFTPGGNYLCNQTCIIRSPGNLTVIGYGARMFRNTATSVFWDNWVATGEEEPGYGVTNYPGYSGPSNVAFYGLTMDGRGSVVADTLTFVMLAHGENYLFEECTFLDGVDNHALDINGMQNVKIVRCTFKGKRTTTSTADIKEAIQLDVAGTFAYSLPFDSTICNGILVEDNYCSASANCAGYGVFFGSHGDPGNQVYHHMVRAVNNHVRDIMFYAFAPMNWRNVTIQGNHVSDANGGVIATVDEDQTSQIGGNTSVLQSVMITGNIFDFMGQPNGYTGGTVSESVIRVNGRSGIPARDVMVVGNIIKSYENASAVNVSNTVGVMVSRNQLKRGTGTGSYTIVSVGNTSVQNVDNLQY